MRRSETPCIINHSACARVSFYRRETPVVSEYDDDRLSSDFIVAKTSSRHLLSVLPCKQCVIDVYRRVRSLASVQVYAKRIINMTLVIVQCHVHHLHVTTWRAERPRTRTTRELVFSVEFSRIFHALPSSAFSSVFCPRYYSDQDIFATRTVGITVRCCTRSNGQTENTSHDQSTLSDLYV